MQRVLHRKLKRWGAVSAAVLLACGVPALAQSGSLAMLGNLAKGEWTIKYRDGSPDRRICVRSGLEFIQLRHSEPNCSRFVVEDGASKVTVQYTCQGNGYGRTNIRRETGSLVQIQSQGIASGLPFQLDAEARRTGSC
ncbi:hypothetical protein [Erythrobacter sp. JK5]|uniref:DUF3617 domain-containing protein n=1 Tax=Erythrobacter sp. JK5 TaxID=2829500 RepID=UPI001BAA6DED|nr:hypothetical protein [Erythrobacter sp. JK5]QUL37481.1 hypothetical protein KDC96_14190 [Erythrobacter sp. JK5]